MPHVLWHFRYDVKAFADVGKRSTQIRQRIFGSNIAVMFVCDLFRRLRNRCVISTMFSGIVLGIVGLQLKLQVASIR